MAGRFFRLTVGLTVSVWMARHLAPEAFGELNYMMSLTAIIGPFAAVGLDGLVVREIIESREDVGETLGTVFWLRLVAGSVLYFTLLTVWWLKFGNGRELWMIALLGFDLILQCANVFDLYFQSQSQNAWTVLAGIISLTIASSMRVLLIAQGASLEYFAGAVLLEMALWALFLAIFYARRNLRRIRWRFCARRACALISKSWPMVVSAAAIAGCMRLDQVMLRVFTDEESVGVYSAAIRLAEAWYFVPMFLGTVLNPWILQGRALGAETYRQRLTRFYAYMLWSAVLLAGILWIAAPLLVNQLFGEDYLRATTPLRIHLMGGVFLTIGIAAGKWYVAEEHTIGVMRKAILGLATNLLLNTLLIPRLGISGAAIGAASGHFAANILYDLMDSRVRPQLGLKLRAFALWRVGLS